MKFILMLLGLVIIYQLYLIRLTLLCPPTPASNAQINISSQGFSASVSDANSAPIFPM